MPSFAPVSLLGACSPYRFTLPHRLPSKAPNLLARKMAQLVKCLSHKDEDQSSGLHHLYKCQVIRTCIPSTGDTEIEGPLGLAG